MRLARTPNRRPANPAVQELPVARVVHSAAGAQPSRRARKTRSPRGRLAGPSGAAEQRRHRHRIVRLRTGPTLWSPVPGRGEQQAVSGRSTPVRIDWRTTSSTRSFDAGGTIRGPLAAAGPRRPGHWLGSVCAASRHPDASRGPDPRATAPAATRHLRNPHARATPFHPWCRLHVLQPRGNARCESPSQTPHRWTTGRRSLGERPAQLGAARRAFYSATLTPEPPISFGISFIFGNPSLIRSFVS